MTCDRIQSLVSARMDGEHLRSAELRAIDAHLPGCSGCRRFAAASDRVRSAVRIRAAEDVPDLVAPIMSAVAVEGQPSRTPRPRRPPTSWPSLRAAVAAALVGILVGAVAVGGLLSPGGGATAIAAIQQGVRAAAPEVASFGATYSIVERGLDPAIPERSLDLEVGYLAPQRFRLEVRDRTSYPSSVWTPTDITYIEDMPSTFLSGPTGCPADLGVAVCPPTRVTVTTSAPYSAAAPLPSDLVLPLSTFASARGVEVVGDETVEGRATVHVRMPFSRAAPLFPFLRLGGTWRPVFDADVTDVWLDAEGWFPVLMTVTPADTPGREAWELRFGRQPDPLGVPILEVRGRSFGGAPEASAFQIAATDKLEGSSLGALSPVLGFEPVVPTGLGSLELAGVVAPPPAASAPRSVLVFSRGLEYLRIGEHPGWRGPGPFGPVGAFGERVELGEAGVGFYAPAGDGLGRRLVVHAASTDLFLESNLPRVDLLAIAGSLPVLGLELPSTWKLVAARELEVEQVTAADGLAALGIAVPAAPLAEGYVASGAALERDEGGVTGLRVFLRQPETDLAGQPLILYLRHGATLEPPSGPGGVRVEVGDAPGRWTAAASRLEWAGAGWVFTLEGGTSLDVHLAVAASVHGWFE